MTKVGATKESKSGQECEDIDECNDPEHGITCPPNSWCQNELGILCKKTLFFLLRYSDFK